MKNQIFFPSFLALLLTFALASSGLAQDIQREVTKVGTVSRKLREGVAVAEKAEAKRSIERYDRVTFDKVLADPDNIELNLQYAQEQVAQNELLGAVATLERILMVNPDLVQVRLFYSVLLYRLGNLQEAKVEFERIAALELPDSVRDEVEKYQKQIRIKEKRTHMTLRETLGWGIDDNRNAAPSSKRVLFLETPLPLTGTNRKRRDTHFMNITSFDIVHDLGFQEGHELFGNFTYFLQEQTKVDSLDLSSYQYELGGTFKSDWFDLSSSFYATHMILSRENFLRSQGGRFALTREWTQKFRTSGSFRIERQEYLPIEENQAARQRSGREAETMLSASYVLRPTMSVNAGVGYANKSAEEDVNAYQRMTISAGHTWLLGKGQFLINSVNFYIDHYDEPELAIASRYRKDQIFRYRVTYGAPLTTLLIGKIMPKMFKDIVFTASYEYYRSLSSVTNYTYKNNKWQMLLTKKLEF